ncbi:MAG: hypothetical protein JSW73_01605 [Candidatus Woesearchaeota archaeon]|nr:MAG: hypothetical protein JSW73_01605 [Candidatus Woesearchaeota archaeon]
MENEAKQLVIDPIIEGLSLNKEQKQLLEELLTAITSKDLPGVEITKIARKDCKDGCYIKSCVVIDIDVDSKEYRTIGFPDAFTKSVPIDDKLKRRIIDRKDRYNFRTYENGTIIRMTYKSISN